MHKDLCGCCVENHLQGERSSRKTSWEAIAIIHEEEMMVTQTREVSAEVTRSRQIVYII